MRRNVDWRKRLLDFIQNADVAGEKQSCNVDEQALCRNRLDWTSTTSSKKDRIAQQICLRSIGLKLRVIKYRQRQIQFFGHQMNRCRSAFIYVRNFINAFAACLKQCDDFIDGLFS